MTIALDLFLSPETDDLDLTNGDITFKADVRQAAQIELEKYADEWFPDREDGVDRDIVFGKARNLAQVEAIYRGRLEALGITITRLDLGLDANRELDLTWDGIEPEVSSVVIGGRA